ncbi:MAG: BF3164 family lipoprotein [Bacteroidales bacterium]
MKNILFKILLLTIVVALILDSCKEDQHELEFNTPNFVINDTVNPYFLNVTKIMGQVLDFTLIDTLLIVSSSDGVSAIQILNKKDGKFISSIARFGRAKGEVVGRYIIPFGNDKTVFLFNNTPNRILVFNRNDLITTSQKDSVINIQFNKGISDIKFLNDKFLLQTAGDSRFVITDLKGKIISTKRDYPSFNNIEDTSIIKGLLSQGNIAVSPDYSKMAYCTRGACGVSLLETFSIINDLKPEKCLRLYAPDYKILSEYNVNGRILKVVNGTPESIIGFLDVAATNKYIYAVFDSNRKKDIDISKAINLYVYDWNGTPIRNYVINCGIRLLTVDSQLNRAYFISTQNSGHEQIGYFNLKENNSE